MSVKAWQVEVHAKAIAAIAAVPDELRGKSKKR